MTSKKPSKSPLKFTTSLGKAAKLQATFDALGLGEVVKIEDRSFDDTTGNVKIVCTLKTENNEAKEALITTLGIKLYDDYNTENTLFGHRVKVLTTDLNSIRLEIEFSNPRQRFPPEQTNRVR